MVSIGGKGERHFLRSAHFSAMLSEVQTANNEYLNEYPANKTKINNTGIFCYYSSTSFRSVNPNFGLRPKLGGQISLWTERKDSAKD